MHNVQMDAILKDYEDIARMKLYIAREEQRILAAMTAMGIDPPSSNTPTVESNLNRKRMKSQ